MNDTDQLALIYESSILLEDAAARKAYLTNKYRKTITDIVTKSVNQWHDDPRNNSTPQHRAGGIKNSINTTIGYIDDMVDEVDPTHGKYSEWLLRQYLNAYSDMVNTMDEERESPEHNAAVARYNHVSQMLDEEDAYKTTEMLQLFDRYKNRLPQNQRDINAFSYEGLEQVTKQWDVQDLTPAERTKEIKTKETVKLVDDLDGWTVVVPLTKDSARLYGAGTRWCTAARGDQSNMFDHYNSTCPLFVFIKGDEKYQLHILDQRKRYQQGYWDDEAGEFIEHEGPDIEVDEPNLGSFKIQLMDVQDRPAAPVFIPANVWKAAYTAPTTNAHIKEGQQTVKQYTQLRKQANDHDQATYHGNRGDGFTDWLKAAT